MIILINPIPVAFCFEILDDLIRFADDYKL